MRLGREVRDRRANHRIRLLLAAFALLFVVAIARAAWVQGAQHDRYSKMAITQHRETIEIPAGRGTIYDRTGEPLAIGEQATTVYADPRNVVDAQRAAVVAGKALGLDASVLYPTLKDRSKGFVYVARKADPQKAEALSKQDIPGLGFYPEELRTYPQGAVAVARARLRRHRQPRARRARALARQDALRAGRASRRSSRTPSVARSTSSPRRPERPGQERDAHDRPPDPGERRADPRAHGATQFGARGGAAAIVMDPRTGAILAMANYPTFDANEFSTASPTSRRNRAVTDAYEPGSTFKIVTIAGALEDNVVSPRRPSPSLRRSRSPTASSTRPTFAAPR